MLAALAGAGLLSAGCQQGIRWELGSYPDVHARAQASQRLLFVYFRSWYLADCTEFEDHVLNNPEVLAEMRDMVCLPLDFDFDRPLAEQWHLDAAPAYAIVAPNGEVIASSGPPIMLPKLLDGIRVAKALLGMRAPLPPQQP